MHFNTSGRLVIVPHSVLDHLNGGDKAEESLRYCNCVWARISVQISGLVAGSPELIMARPTTRIELPCRH